MKRIFLLALTALVSFAVGIASATIWISKHSPTVPPVASSNNCTPVYDATFVGKRINENDDPQLFAAFQEPPLYTMPDCVDEAYSLTSFFENLEKYLGKRTSSSDPLDAFGCCE